MSNAGLPEAGDAVLTFPRAVRVDAARYAAAAALPSGGAVDARAAAARARRDLALQGFEELRAGGAEALAELHRDAVRLVAPKIDEWSRLWKQTVEAETERTRDRLAALAAGDPAQLSDAIVTRAPEVSAERGYGMCGRLRTWHWPTDALESDSIS
jgi:hypothetical protein